MATPAPPRSAASVANPRHASAATQAAEVPTSSSIVKPDYMVLSAAVPPGGAAAVVAVQQLSADASPAALHDVEFLEQVARELPPDAPILASMLYTHKSVVNADEGADSLIRQVDDSVARWKQERVAQAVVAVELQLTESKQEQLESHKDFVRRDVEHNRALKRMEELIAQMEKKIEASIGCDASATGIDSQESTATPLRHVLHNPAAWAELNKRNLAIQQEAVEACHRLNVASAEHVRNQQEIERNAQQSKYVIEEAVCRSVARADEEAERLQLAFAYRNEKVLRLLEGDCSGERRDLLALEEKQRALLHELCIEDERRALRHTSIVRAFASLLHHTEASESGMRFNIDVDEQRQRLVVVEEMHQRSVVLEVVDAAMFGSRRPQ